VIAPEADVEVVRGFRVQREIAAFECGRGQMRAVGVQLLRCGGTLRALCVHAQMQMLAEHEVDASGQAQRREILIGIVAIRIVGDTIDASAQLQTMLAEVAALDQEQAEAPSDHRRHEGFFADRFEIAVRDMQAGNAHPCAQRPVRQFHTTFLFTYIEGGAHGATGFDFLVLVVVDADAGFQAIEAGQGIVEQAAQIHACLLHVDTYAVVAVAFLFRLFAFVFM
jgi:hypothetical protein